jgi:glycerol uptake facilitator-like aquaporin
MFSDSFAGIAPSSVLPFIGAQIVGALIGLALVVALYPDAARSADQAVIPHERHISESGGGS